MSEKSLSISPAIEPFAGAVAGLGLGYTMAPRKYSLKRLLIMKPEKISQIYTDSVQKNMSQKQKTALANILAAKSEYAKSRLANMDEIKKTARIWHDEFKKVTIPEKLKENYQRSRTILKNAIQEENYVALNQEYRAAKEAVKKNPEDINLKAALNKANANLARAKAKIAGKIETYTNSVKNISNERLYNIKSKPPLWMKAKDAYNDFLVALAKRRTISTNKLFELSNKKSLLKDYETIKQFLPKARTKSAITGAALLGGFTTLIAAYLNPSPVKS